MQPHTGTPRDAPSSKARERSPPKGQIRSILHTVSGSPQRLFCRFPNSSLPLQRIVKGHHGLPDSLRREYPSPLAPAGSPTRSKEKHWDGARWPSGRNGAATLTRADSRRRLCIFARGARGTGMDRRTLGPRGRHPRSRGPCRDDSMVKSRQCQVACALWGGREPPCWECRCRGPMSVAARGGRRPFGMQLGSSCTRVIRRGGHACCISGTPCGVPAHPAVWSAWWMRVLSLHRATSRWPSCCFLAQFLTVSPPPLARRFSWILSISRLFSGLVRAEEGEKMADAQIISHPSTAHHTMLPLLSSPCTAWHSRSGARHRAPGGHSADAWPHIDAQRG